MFVRRPAVVERPLVLVVEHVGRADVLDLLEQRGVENLRAQRIAEITPHRQALVVERRADHAFQLGFRVAQHHFVVHVVAERVRAVFLDEQLLARRGVDSRRAHAPDRRGTAAVVVAGHPRERGPALVVERTERIADLGVLRLGVRAVQADVPVDGGRAAGRPATP